VLRHGVLVVRYRVTGKQDALGRKIHAQRGRSMALEIERLHGHIAEVQGHLVRNGYLGPGGTYAGQRAYQRRVAGDHLRALFGQGCFIKTNR